MQTVTYSERDIREKPSIIDGLILKWRDSEARTRTFLVPDQPVVVPEPVAEPKPANAKPKRKK